jgi:hypothetical protein
LTENNNNNNNAAEDENNERDWQYTEESITAKGAEARSSFTKIEVEKNKLDYSLFKRTKDGQIDLNNELKLLQLHLAHVYYYYLHGYKVLFLFCKHCFLTSSMQKFEDRVRELFARSELRRTKSSSAMPSQMELIGAR